VVDEGDYGRVETEAGPFAGQVHTLPADPSFTCNTNQ
jgi:hypothetical protein